MFQCTQTNFNASKVLLISMNQRHTISLGTKMVYVGILRKIKMLNLLISYLQVCSDISYIRVKPSYSKKGNITTCKERTNVRSKETM